MVDYPMGLHDVIPVHPIGGGVLASLMEGHCHPLNYTNNLSTFASHMKRIQHRRLVESGQPSKKTWIDIGIEDCSFATGLEEYEYQGCDYLW